MTLTPAHGRDYKSIAALKKDINAGKDFILNDITSRWNGKPCSACNFKGQRVQFRYNKLRHVTTILL